MAVTFAGGFGEQLGGLAGDLGNIRRDRLLKEKLDSESEKDKKKSLEAAFNNAKNGFLKTVASLQEAEQRTPGSSQVPASRKFFEMAFGVLSRAIEVTGRDSQILEVIRQNAERTILTPAGPPPGAAGSAQLAGDVAQEQAQGRENVVPTAVDTITLQFPDNTTQTFNARTQKSEIQAALDAGANKVSLGVQAESTEGLFGGKGTGEIEGREIGINESLGQLDLIEEGFKPEFLTLPTKLLVGGLNLAEKAGLDISPEQQQLVTEFTLFTRDAISGLNSEIQRLTGAQLSEFEAGRIRRGFPDPEKDGPTKFKANLDGVIRSLRASAFRLKALRELGFKGLITPAVERQFPLRNFEPPSDEPGSKIVSVDGDGNPTFERPDGSTFKMVP